MNERECKARIDYPCSWVYKVIGRDREALRGAITEVMRGCGHTVTPSRSSAGSSYHCLNVELTVESETVRLDIYNRLCRHPCVIMVM